MHASGFACGSDSFDQLLVEVESFADLAIIQQAPVLEDEDAPADLPHRLKR